MRVLQDDGAVVQREAVPQGPDVDQERARRDDGVQPPTLEGELPSRGGSGRRSRHDTLYTRPCAPVTRYRRLGGMLHLEQRPAAPPDVDDLEPTRVGAEQRVELLVRAGTKAAHQDERYALALEV